jgi:hypothetical protein
MGEHKPNPSPAAPSTQNVAGDFRIATALLTFA